MIFTSPPTVDQTHLSTGRHHQFFVKSLWQHIQEQDLARIHSTEYYEYNMYELELVFAMDCFWKLAVYRWMINKKIIASPLKINLSFLPHASIPKDREFPLTFVKLIAARDRNLGPQRKGHLRVQLLTVSMTKRYEKLNHIDVHFVLHCCKSNFVGREGLKATRCLLTLETYIIYRQKKAFDFF